MDRTKHHSSPFINVVKGVFFVVRVILVPVSYLSAPSHGIEDQDEYRFGDGTLLFQENEVSNTDKMLILFSLVL
jgi:hypothetical protein